MEVQGDERGTRQTLEKTQKLIIFWGAGANFNRFLLILAVYAKLRHFTFFGGVVMFPRPKV